MNDKKPSTVFESSHTRYEIFVLRKNETLTRLGNTSGHVWNGPDTIVVRETSKQTGSRQDHEYWADDATLWQWLTQLLRCGLSATQMGVAE